METGTVHPVLREPAISCLKGRSTSRVGDIGNCAHDPTHKIHLFPPRKDADVGHPYQSE